MLLIGLRWRMFAEITSPFLQSHHTMPVELSRRSLLLRGWPRHKSPTRCYDKSPGCCLVTAVELLRSCRLAIVRLGFGLLSVQFGFELFDCR